MLKKIAMFSLLSCVSAISLANVETLKSNLSRHYPNIQVSNIQATEMSGLYSASLDKQIIYLDENAQHMFIGSMVRLNYEIEVCRPTKEAGRQVLLNNGQIQGRRKTVRRLVG